MLRNVIANSAKLCCFAFYALLSAPVEARFLDDDAEEVDREERLNTENFNDEVSYRPPFSWLRLWEKHDFAFRANGGSYNANRFMYEEDIKLRSPLDKPATFSFTQERQQNLIGNASERELRVRLNTLKPFIPAIMADTDSWKRSADVGSSLMLSDDETYGIEAYAWAVNYFYNEKKGDTQNVVRKPARTIGAKAFYRTGDWYAQFKAEHDRLLIWDRISDNHEYRYERRRYEALLSYGSKERDWYHELSTQHEFKQESKYFYLKGTDNVEKNLDQRNYWIEYKLNYAREGKSDFTQGLYILERDADYDDIKRPGPKGTTGAVPESKSPDVSRTEQAYYATYFFLTEYSRSLGFQYGLFVNNVYLRKSPYEKRRTEIKFQSALSYLFTEKIASFFNATWNLDGLAHNYPYTKERFQPWDGGSIQFVATF